MSVSVSVFEFAFEGGEREREACRGGAKRGARSVRAKLTRLAGLTQRRDFPHALHPREPEHRQPRATLEHELEHAHAHAHASPLN